MNLHPHRVEAKASLMKAENNFYIKKDSTRHQNTKLALHRSLAILVVEGTSKVGGPIPLTLTGPFALTQEDSSEKQFLKVIQNQPHCYEFRRWNRSRRISFNPSKTFSFLFLPF